MRMRRAKTEASPGQEKMGVGRGLRHKVAVEHIEECTFGIALGIGQETKKARETQQKPEMKVGLALVHHVKETYRLGEKVEKGGIGLGLTEEAGEHLGEKKCHGRLHRVAVDAVPHLDGTHLAQPENILAGTRLGVDFEIREWGKQGPQGSRPPAVRLRQEIGGAPKLRGIDLHYRHFVVIGDGVQYNSLGFCLHTDVKKGR